MNIISKIVDKEIITVVSLVIALIIVTKEYIKSVTKTEFERIFVAKEQTHWYKMVSVIISNVIACILITAFGFFQVYGENSIANSSIVYRFIYIASIGLFILSSFLISISCLYMFVSRIRTKRKGVSDKEINVRFKNYNFWVVFINFVSITIIIIGLWFTSISLFDDGEFNFGQFFSLICFLQFTLFMVWYFETEVILMYLKVKMQGKTLFKFSIPNQEQIKSLHHYVLYSIDSKYLVLGDKEIETESSFLLLYDIEKDHYKKFLKVKSKK